MSTNLVSNITQVLSSNFVSRVASSLELDGAQVEKALQAGTPALLAALTSLVSKPAGAAALNGAVAQQAAWSADELGQYDRRLWAEGSY